MDGDSAMNDFTADDSASLGAQTPFSVSTGTPSPARGSTHRQPSEDALGAARMRRHVQPNRRRPFAVPNQMLPTSSSGHSFRYVDESANQSSIRGATDAGSEEPEGSARRWRRQQALPPVNRQPNRRVTTTANADDYDWNYRPLGQSSQLGELEQEDEDEDAGSDGTTVGVSQSSVTGNATSRRTMPAVTENLTAVARPASRSGVSRYPRGLRRRSSVLSVSSSLHYEDNDADDEDVDQEGNVQLAPAQVRHHPSMIRIRNNGQENHSPRSAARGQNSANPIEVESDDSENSGHLMRQGQQVRRPHRAYDPQISFMFAQHLENQIEQHDSLAGLDPFALLRASTRTPVARPRTSNRNRAHNSHSAQSSIMSPNSGSSQHFPTNLLGRHYTASIESTASPGFSRSSLDRAGAIPGRMTPSDSTRAGPSSRDVSLTPNSRAELPSFRGLSSLSPNSGASGFSNDSLGDSIERPASRVSFRASAPPRRGSGQFIQAASQPGLNAARAWQNNNPFFNQIRPRPSGQRLREQSSTATLRPRNSIRVLRNQPTTPIHRDATASPTQIRIQPSRINLRPQPSMHRLQSQTSSRGLRTIHQASTAQREALASATIQANARASASASNPRASPGTNSTLSEDERQRRAREMVERRSAQLRSNPFTRTPQQGSSSRDSPIGGSVHSSTAGSSAGMSTGINTSSDSLTQSALISTAPTAPSVANPAVGRSRSNRQISQPSGSNGTASPVQVSFPRFSTNLHQPNSPVQQNRPIVGNTTRRRWWVKSTKLSILTFSFTLLHATSRRVPTSPPQAVSVISRLPLKIGIALAFAFNNSTFF